MRSLNNNLEKTFGIKRLKALGATTFARTTDPADAEGWMNVLEKCFKVMRCLDDRKVELATFLLKKEADYWWRTFESQYHDTNEINWNEFKNAFYEKYYPRSYKDAKRSEFL